jgi:hypothetical protein
MEPAPRYKSPHEMCLGAAGLISSLLAGSAPLPGSLIKWWADTLSGAWVCWFFSPLPQMSSLLKIVVI